MHVLIVDDSQEIRSIVATHLSLFGWDIDQAENGADALAIHARKNNPLDAILLDQMMPGMDGLTVLPKLLEINPQCPVIMLTAHGSIPLVTTFMQSGGSSFIEKPITNFEILKLRIEEVIHFTKHKRELEEIRSALQVTAMLNHDKDHFLANLSHELRTPLMSILEFATLAKRRWMENKPEEAMAKLERLLAGRDRLLRFVNHIELLARIHTGQLPYIPTADDLIPLVLKMVQEMEHHPDQKTLQWRVTGDSTVLACFDGPAIRITLTELLNNAERFSPPGGVVDLVVTHSPEWVSIAIRDTGPGLPQGEEETIFAPFTESSRTRSQAGGAGLGLAVAMGLARYHGGKIHAANRTNGPGAEFTLELPRGRKPS